MICLALDGSGILKFEDCTQMQLVRYHSQYIKKRFTSRTHQNGTCPYVYHICLIHVCQSWLGNRPIEGPDVVGE
jgi:hypothetical protein